MTKQRPDFELNRPGAVIAALPAVLGFVPEKSLVVISIDGAGCPMCNEEYRDLCATLTEELAQRDIVVWAAHVVDRVAAGGRWHCVDGCGAGGVIDDPSASPLAVAAVLDGRRLYARRADLQSVIAVDERAASAAMTDCR